MMGIANQLMSVIALSIGTICILNRSSKRIYALATALPLAGILGIVLYASYLSITGWAASISKAVSATDAIQYYLLVILVTLMVFMTLVVVVDAAIKATRILKAGKPAARPDAAA
jgi:carbon starvation protein CstA